MPSQIELLVFVHDEQEPRRILIDEEGTVDVLIREISPDHHSELDIFLEAEEHPRERHHRLLDCGIRHGHRIHCRPKHHGHHGNGHKLPEHPEIFIDKKHYRAPKNPMTGAELRVLGGVDPGYDLWEVVPGSDDVRIENQQSVKLKEGEHFYTAPSTLNPGSK